MIHKPYELPEVSLTHDEADPEWEKYGTHGHKVERDGQTLYRWHRPPGVHANYWAVIKDEWAARVAAYEAHPDDFINAYYYLDEHPVFWGFKPRPKDDERAVNHLMYLEHQYGVSRVIDLRPVRCSKDHRIEDDASLNTQTEIWYEFGPVTLIPDDWGNTHWHDYLLDGTAPTYEEAVTEVARKVHEHYGNDRRVVDTEAWKNGDRNYGDPKIKEFYDNLGKLFRKHVRRGRPEGRLLFSW